jgi:hypothetical protein
MTTKRLRHDISRRHMQAHALINFEAVQWSIYPQHYILWYATGMVTYIGIG